VWLADMNKINKEI